MADEAILKLVVVDGNPAGQPTGGTPAGGPTPGATPAGAANVNQQAAFTNTGLNQAVSALMQAANNLTFAAGRMAASASALTNAATALGKAQPSGPPPLPKPIVLKPAFDPYDEARKLFERQQQQHAIGRAYDELYGSMSGKLIKFAGQFRGLLGGVFGPVAGGFLDVASSVQGAGAFSGAAGAASAMPIVGAVIGAFVVAVGSAIKALKALDEALVRAADRYEGYSPELAFAQAMADVRTTFADIRRAQELGPRLAEYITTRNQLENKWEDAKAKFLEKAEPFLNEVLKHATIIVEFLGELIEAGGPFLELATSALKVLNEILGATKKDEDLDISPRFDPFSIQVPMDA